VAQPPHTFKVHDAVHFKPTAKLPSDWQGLHNLTGRVELVLTHPVYKQNPARPTSYEILIGKIPNGFIEVIFETAEGKRRIHAPAEDFEAASKHK
jgi:hypothetical protein